MSLLLKVPSWTSSALITWGGYHLLDMQNLGLHPRSVESESALTKMPCDVYTHKSSVSTYLNSNGFSSVLF